MRRSLPLLFLLLGCLFLSCDREIEESQTEFGVDYQPLGIGLFWIYQVDQTIYFGENDTETSSFFYRDRVISFFLNEEEEQVFILERSTSQNQIDWLPVLNYSLLIRDFSLVRNFENQITVPVVFPPDLGTSWDGNIYTTKGLDEYEVVPIGEFNSILPSVDTPVRILQNEEDDLITFRDNRYEVYGKGIGLVEKYTEILTYCSRNDCLGEELIDSGEETLMKLISYGNE